MKTRHRKHLLAKLRPGAWLRISYGYDRIDFCMLAEVRGICNGVTVCREIIMENPRWSITSCLQMDVRDLMQRNPQFLGYGKYRPIGSRIRRWTKYFCTIYTRPKP